MYRAALRLENRKKPRAGRGAVVSQGPGNACAFHGVGQCCGLGLVVVISIEWVVLLVVATGGSQINQSINQRGLDWIGLGVM
jgi:hypothetical protein